MFNNSVSGLSIKNSDFIWKLGSKSRTLAFQSLDFDRHLMKIIHNL